MKCRIFQFSMIGYVLTTGFQTTLVASTFEDPGERMEMWRQTAIRDREAVMQKIELWITNRVHFIFTC